MLTTTLDSWLNKQGQYQIDTNINISAKSIIITFTVSDSEKTSLQQSLVDYFGELTDMKNKYPDEPDYEIFDEAWQGMKGKTAVAYRILTDPNTGIIYTFLTYAIMK